jgi:WXG100 family type VII secretion target
VYGTVQSDGTFISADGSLLQLPNGFIEHGKVLPDNSFLAVTTVNGNQVWGSFGSDGSFLSQDGTIYVSPSGAVETGVTDPNTKSFLQGGTTYTLPNGTILYGYADAGGFYTYDGKTIVLNDGTVVTGSLNTGDGIFTGNNGSYYFIGKNGIVTATPQSDGSFLLPDGGVVMTPQSWKVDLPEMDSAIQLVKSRIASISDSYDTIQLKYGLVETVWSSPAGTSFADVTSTIDNAMKQMTDVLGSIYSAMQATYDNYLKTEQTNTKNFTG